MSQIPLVNYAPMWTGIIVLVVIRRSNAATYPHTSTFLDKITVGVGIVVTSMAILVGGTDSNLFMDYRTFIQNHSTVACIYDVCLSCVLIFGIISPCVICITSANHYIFGFMIRVQLICIIMWYIITYRYQVSLNGLHFLMSTSICLSCTSASLVIPRTTETIKTPTSTTYSNHIRNMTPMDDSLENHEQRNNNKNKNNNNKYKNKKTTMGSPKFRPRRILVTSFDDWKNVMKK